MTGETTSEPQRTEPQKINAGSSETGIHPQSGETSTETGTHPKSQAQKADMSPEAPLHPETEAESPDRQLQTEALAAFPVLQHEEIYAGRVWGLVKDTVDLGAGGVVVREYLNHPGAVAILALDEHDNVLLQRQYRHPVRRYLWELPAGLLDIDGEPPLVAAQRELAEEADLAAESWHVLVDWYSSPGGNDEALRCYVARDLREIPHQHRHQRTDEEVDMIWHWLPLEQAAAAVLRGEISHPGAVVGILAAAHARTHHWRTLRPADAPWPQHPYLGG